MQIVKSDISNKGKMLLATITGELVQPVRVYYRIQDKGAIMRVFSKLKCMDFDAKRDRYVWLYQKEAKKLIFKKPYSSIPSKYKPLVIGSFFLKQHNEMYLEARSIERAIEGMVFFDGYIKTYMAKVEDISIINKLFSPEENTMDFTDFFAREVIIDPEEKLNKLRADLDQGKTFEGILNETERELLPEVERFPSHFYEDGITPLKFTLRGRQYAALERKQKLHFEGLYFRSSEQVTFL